MDAIISWFVQQGGTIDSASMGLTDFPGQGRGAIALQDIPKDHVLFTLPRSLTLSLRTSRLPDLVGQGAWKKLQLDRGWVGLILCMMWEEVQGEMSKWSGYLRSLPTDFDTPMFWTSDELKELDGTSIADKIGRNDAERDYTEKLIPALESRPDLFEPEQRSTCYSLANYHLMGSRILSRSFHVERAEGEGSHSEEAAAAADISVDSQGSAMSVDADDAAPVGTEGDGMNDDSESEDEDAEDPADVAMVPMADMLNARYNSENARLFYKQVELKMTTTRPIYAGDQIYNTYANPPNSDLLRRYGHVDLIPQSAQREGEALEGNPADVVDINADLITTVIALQLKRVENGNELKERINWWLDEGGDDMFTLETDASLPDALISFTKLLLCTDEEWWKLHDKGKPPKPKLDAQVIAPLALVLHKRLEKYPTTLEEDELFLSANIQPPLSRKAKAVIVRVGEKRIINNALAKLQEQATAELTQSDDKNSSKKRKGDNAGREGKRSKQ